MRSSEREAGEGTNPRVVLIDFSRSQEGVFGEGEGAGVGMGLMGVGSSSFSC